MSQKKFNVILNSKITPFKKIIKVDSDKSLSIRSFLISSISQNISKVNNVLESEDVKSAIKACRRLGVKINKVNTKTYKIYGKGLGSLFAKKNDKLNFVVLWRCLVLVLNISPNCHRSKVLLQLFRRNTWNLFQSQQLIHHERS